MHQTDMTWQKNDFSKLHFFTNDVKAKKDRPFFVKMRNKKWYNDIQQNDTQDNDIQHNNLKTRHSIKSQRC